MKEKTFKDLGLDEGDKYLEQLSSQYDLGDLSNILEEDENDDKETKKKMKEIKDKI